MSSIGQALAAVLLALPATPAAAASPALETHLGQLTLAPGGAEKATLLWMRIATGTEGSHHIAVTLDYSDVTGFAKVDLALAFDASAAAARAIDPAVTASPSGTTGPCTNAGTAITCAWDSYLPAADLVLPVAIVVVSPTSGAAEGDEGALTVTAKLDDTTSATGTSSIRVGAAVDLAATTGGEVDAAPGKSATVTPSVSNAGTAAIDGVALAVAGSSGLLGKTSYRNCRYGEDLVLCTFDTSIPAGSTYTLSQPFTLTPPADSVPGSATQFAVQWITAAEYDDYVDIFPDNSDEYVGTPGTGNALDLTLSTGAQGGPQSDVNNKNDAATYTLMVDGTDTQDLAAIGAKHRATLGSEVAIEVGMLNRGPGTLHPELYENNVLTTRVQLPANVVPADVDPRCDEAGYMEPVYTCALVHALASGERDIFGFTVQIATRRGEAGEAQVTDALTEANADPSADPSAEASADPSNNTAAIVVTATGSEATLPITGEDVARIAATGLALVVIGTLLTVRRGGRRIGAHARGKWGRREGRAR